MPSGTEILKELFVSLGWTHDEASRKKVVEAEKKTTVSLEKESKEREVFAKKARESLGQSLKGLLAFQAAAETMAVGVVGVLEKVAKSFDAIHYTSQRTGASAKEIGAFGFAVSKMGGNAEEATASLEALAQQIKANPGYKLNIAGMLQKAGIGFNKEDLDDNFKLVTLFGQLLAKMPPVQARQFKAMYPALGSETLYNAVTNPKELQKQIELYNAQAKAMGINLDQATEDGHNLTNQFKDLYNIVDLITKEFASQAFKDLQQPIKDLGDYLKDHGRDIADVLTKMAKALLSMLTFVVEHLRDFDHFATVMGGWQNVFMALGALVTAQFVAPFVALFGALRGLSLLAMPPWLLGVLGVGAGALAGDAWLKNHTPGTPEGDANEPSYGDAKKGNEGGGWWGGRAWGAIKRGLGFGGGGSADAKPRSGGWWTPERQKHAFDVLREEGVSERGAIALISRWKNVESTNAGPDSLNPSSGAYGIEQGLGSRKPRTNNFDEQLRAAARETKNAEGRGSGRIFDTAKDDREAARGASVHERAEGWNGYTDNFQARTLAGMEEVRRNVLGPAKAPPMVRGGDADWRNHRGGKVPMPAGMSNPFGGFDPAKLRSTMSPPPLASMPTDNSRVVTINQNNTNHVTGVSDPTAAAAQIGARQDRHASILLRNMQSAVV